MEIYLKTYSKEFQEKSAFCNGEVAVMSGIRTGLSKESQTFNIFDPRVLCHLSPKTVIDRPENTPIDAIFQVFPALRIIVSIKANYRQRIILRGQVLGGFFVLGVLFPLLVNGWHRPWEAGSRIHS